MSPCLKTGYNPRLNDIIKLFPGMSRVEIALSRTTLFFQGFREQGLGLHSCSVIISFSLAGNRWISENLHISNESDLLYRGFQDSMTTLWKNLIRGKGIFLLSLSPILNSFLPTSWCVHIQRITSNPAYFAALASVISPVISTAPQNWEQAV